MRYCGKCGCENVDEARFCRKCGAPLEVISQETPKPEIESRSMPAQEPTVNAQPDSARSVNVQPESAQPVSVQPVTVQGENKSASKKSGDNKGVKIAAIACSALAVLALIVLAVFMIVNKGGILPESKNDTFATADERSSKDDGSEKKDDAEKEKDSSDAVSEEKGEESSSDENSDGDVNPGEGETEGEGTTAAEDVSKVYTGEKEDINIEIRQVDNSQFPAVTVYVNVTDQNGETVEDISPIDFLVTEVDAEGEVTNCKMTDVYRMLGEANINVNLVLDASGSMAGDSMTQAKNAAKALLEYMSLSEGDQVEIISFDDYVYVDQIFTSDKSSLISAVEGIDTGSSTALYDAIYSGVLQTYYQSGAKCVIAFTDGNENASSYTFDDVVNIARNTAIPVYIIGINDYSYDAQTLQDLAMQCSGRYYSANDSDIQTILQDIYISIYREQQDYYIFEYETPNTDDIYEFRDMIIETTPGTKYNGSYEKSYVPVSDIKGAFSEKYMYLDYILDFSSQREVTEADLENLSLAELRIARNEIFARHGRQFKDPLLNQWFYSKDWYLCLPNKYSPTDFDKNNPNPLSKLESKNADFILSYEKDKMANEDIYPDAATVSLSGYDLALSKQVLKTALSQMEKYSSTTILEENKKLVQEAINNPDVKY